MFANLKNKLIEEVKASPSKFQQFAAAVSSSASTTPSGSESTTTTTTTNENFFSITEEDTPQNSPYKALKSPAGATGARVHHNGPGESGGAIPRTRKLSNSSMASDVSFRLPAYESPPLYQLQSDLDSNCSELEDTTSTAKLDVITKEQLFDAYKKSLDRYQRYRSRYTDLAKKYKDLERDSSKARSVLVETQEKAIRRISELREQCTLEQEAKAHLEEALRMEMDDMQCKMQAYQTKLKLIGENPDNISAANLSLIDEASGGASLIDLDDNMSIRNQVNQQLDTNDKININNIENTTLVNSLPQITQLKAELEARQCKIEELTLNMLNAGETIEQLRKQEEENALLLAQTKKAIHSELESKESEVKKLKENISFLQKDLQETTKEDVELNGQAEELKELREKFKSLQLSKQETDAKLIAAEHMLGQLKEQHSAKINTLKAGEEKLTKTLKDSEQKYEEIRQRNAQLSEMIQRYQQNEVSLAEIDNELNRTKNENDNLKTAIEKSEGKQKEFEAALSIQKEQLERMQQEKKVNAERWKDMSTREEELSKALQEIKAESEMHKERVKQLQTELELSNERNAQNDGEAIAALKVKLQESKQDTADKLKALTDQIANKDKELKTNTNKLSKQKKLFDSQHNQIQEQSDEIEMLRAELNKHEQHLSKLQTETRTREEQAEAEKARLRAQVQSILQDITQMQEEMSAVKQSHSQLEAEKFKLEQLIESMEQTHLQNISDDGQVLREQLESSENKLQQLEAKLQNIETENSQLAERNCLLEEQNNRIEKQLTERVRQLEIVEANANELRLKLDTKEIAMQKLNDKLSEVLDENSRMHNAQELMDHDHRTLQDKYDALEKKKLKTEDEQACLQEELNQTQERKMVLEIRLRETVEQLQQAEEKCAEEKKNAEAFEEELKEMTKARERLDRENQVLSTELNNLRAVQSDEGKLQTLVRNQKSRIEELELELAEKQAEVRSNLDKAYKDNMQLKERVNELEASSVELEYTKKQNILQQDQIAELKQELSRLNIESTETQETCQKLEKQVAEMKESLRDKEANEIELGTLRAEMQKIKECEMEALKQQLESANFMSEQLQAAELEIQKLQETENYLRAEATKAAEVAAKKVHELETKLSTAHSDIERLHESNDAIQVKMDTLQNKHELQVQSLEAALKQLRDDNERFQKELANWKVDAEKLSSLEQLQIENEYLNKNVKQLETELEAQSAKTYTQHKECQDLREKLKSLQCETYVLRENTAKFDVQLAEKEAIIESVQKECEALREKLRSERAELERQLVHTKYITEQNDALQSDLLQKQHQLTETEQQFRDKKLEYNEMKSLYDAEKATKMKEIETLSAELQKTKVELEASTKLQQELDTLRAELAEKCNLQEQFVLAQAATADGSQKLSAAIGAHDAKHLRRLNETLQSKLEDLKHKSTAEITELHQEVEDMQSYAKEMAEKLVEVESLRAALNSSNTSIHRATNTDLATSSKESSIDVKDEERLQHEKAELAAKLHEIMNEVRDVSERNIFLEQQCENYLILEQSNERLKLQNAKLSRQLDETLVSMQHNEGITANTEFEYLRNIMFQYLTGSANGNNETLVKVISAVLKFSPQQTQVALEKEHQRRSLLNKIL
ncbi:golgin subfamily A member 4-like [Eurosta solidaginis]|uniref:golgin subfamily A member 4-like n=1 Tax=Eurosta solidaginis TaxID=178769 RepID=UPI00353089CA